MEKPTEWSATTESRKNTHTHTHSSLKKITKKKNVFLLSILSAIIQCLASSEIGMYNKAASHRECGLKIHRLKKQ